MVLDDLQDVGKSLAASILFFGLNVEIPKCPDQETSEILTKAVHLAGVGSGIEELEDYEPDENQQELVVRFRHITEKVAQVETCKRIIDAINRGDGIAQTQLVGELSRSSKQSGETENYWSNYSDCHKSERVGLPTGTVWDRMMTLQRGELGVVLGLPSTGKSAALVDIGAGHTENCEEDELVLHITMEMSPEQTARRYMGRLGRTGMPLIIARPRENTSAAIRDIVEEVMELEGKSVRALIVDYLGKMLGDRGTMAKHDILGQEAAALRLDAIRYNYVCWTGQQVKRRQTLDTRINKLQDSLIDMDWVADCWGVAHEADQIISLNQTQEERELSKMRLFWSKIREPNADAPVSFVKEVIVDYANSLFI